jgi:hypothetical protein
VIGPADGHRARPEAVVELVVVDELCRLALCARRLGCRVLLVDVGPDLREVLELAGVDDLLSASECQGLR